MTCRRESNQKLFVYHENKSKLTLQNNDQVSSISIKVDGCEINDSSIRCDFMHIAKEIEFFIELKGQDIEHAVSQIINTINRLSSDVRAKEKRSYIICTRSPLSSTKIQKYKYLFKKNYNSDFIVKSSPHKDYY